MHLPTFQMMNSDSPVMSSCPQTGFLFLLHLTLYIHSSLRSSPFLARCYTHDVFISVCNLLICLVTLKARRL
jgi:hypothetical protein